MNPKFIFILLLGVIGFSIFSGEVLAVGQADVLSDIRGLVDLYITNQCNVINNISYGDLEGCKTNSTSTFALNYNIGLPLIAFLGRLDNNETMINRSINGLVAMSRLQNDIGDFAVEDTDELQSPTSSPVQVYMTGVALADTYNRTYTNLTETQRNELQKMFVDLLSWSTNGQSTISYQGSGASFDRMSDFYFRKQLNISNTALNSSDNFHLYFRVNKIGNPVRSNISVYIGENKLYNYTYDTEYINVDKTTFLEIQLNKTQMLSACSQTGTESICNFTFVRKNDVWNSSDYYGLGRTASYQPTDNRSWTSTDGSTWTTSSQERIVQLKYYDNLTLSKIEEYRAVSNQYSTKGLLCYRIYTLLNENIYPISKGIAQRCYENITQSLINQQQNGVYNEWNEMYRDYGGNSSQPVFKGYSDHYQWITSFNLAQLYNLTNNSTYFNSLNTSLNNLNYFIYGNDLIRAGGFGTRDQDNITRLDSIGGSWNMYPFLAFYSLMDSKDLQANIINQKIKLYSEFNPSLKYDGISRFAYDMYPILYLYENFPTSTTSESQITNQNRYFKDLSNIGLISVGTRDYRFYISYLNNSATNSIGNINRKSDNSIIFIGTADSDDNGTRGIGCINIGDNSSCFDTSAILNIGNIYPYSITFEGNLTNRSGTKSGTTFKNNYTFYDDSFYIYQNNSGNINIISPLDNLINALIYNSSNRTIGSTTINNNDGNINATITPSSWIYVLDNYKINESESRANNPISISGSNTQKTITSSLVDTITSDVVTSFGGSCDYSRFTLTLADGTKQTINNNYNCDSGQYTFTGLTIQSGNEVLTASATCTLGERIGYPLILLFVALSILLLVIIFLKGNMDLEDWTFTNLNVRTLIIATIFISVAVAFFIVYANTIFGSCPL